MNLSLEQYIEETNTTYILSSYYIQATLCSLYSGLISWDYWQRKHDKAHGMLTHRITDAIKASLNVFTDAALIFSLAIVIAALHSTSNPDNSIIEVSLAQEASFFSISAVLLLITLDDLAYNDTPRRPGRYLIFLILIILWIAEGWVSSYDYPKTDWPNWESYCGFHVLPAQAIATFVLARIWFGLFWLWVLTFYAFPWLAGRWLPRAAQWLRQHRSYTTAAYLILCMVVIWALLIDITVVRQLFLEWSGSDSQDVEWSFGQVVALSTWLPVLIELGYLIASELTLTPSFEVS